MQTAVKRETLIRRAILSKCHRLYSYHQQDVVNRISGSSQVQVSVSDFIQPSGSEAVVCGRMRLVRCRPGLPIAVSLVWSSNRT